MYKLIIALSLILSTACQQKNIITKEPAVEYKKTAISKETLTAAKLSSWSIKGAIAFNSPKNHGSGSIFWKQNHDNYDVRIIGPLGSGSIHFFGNSTKVTYIDGKNKIISDKPYQFLSKISGLHVPLNSLAYWVRGLPTKNDGYIVTYLESKNIKGIDLPTKLKIQNSEVLVKLAINTWQF